MVGSWPCKVSSEIHINGRCVSEPVHEDKSKSTAPEPEDRRDLKSACVVLSKGHEVVGSGYSRVIGVAPKVMDKREIFGSHDQVNRVSQNSNTDRQVDWVSRVSPNSSTDRQTYQVRWVNWVSRVDNMEQKKGGSSGVANTESQIMENSANMENRITANSANTENWVMQDSGGKKPEEQKDASPSKSLALPKGYYHDAKT
jgi:hypothetical protein